MTAREAPERSVSREAATTGDDGGGVALRVEGLTKVYGDGTLAVDDIDFAVDRGAFCVLIGPSGCGKTTTLHSIIGKVEPTEGRILIGGEDVTDAPIHERNVSLVFQDFQLFPHLSVEENIRYGLERTGESEDQIRSSVDRVLELIQLSEARDRSPESLSAGQKQRVALARSLVLDPELLLLDEPLGDLDYKMQKRMERELLRIHRELDITFVYVTHDQTQAMRLADQVVVMNDGGIEQSGTVGDVYDRPASAFVAAFVGDSNILHGEVTAADPEAGTVEVDTAHGTFVVNAGEAHGEDLVGTERPFVVRPRFVRLDDTADNTVACSVQDVIHQPGRGTQVLLDTAGDDSTSLQLKSFERLVPPENSVTVGWDVDDALLLEETSLVSEDVDLQKDILGE